MAKLQFKFKKSAKSAHRKDVLARLLRARATVRAIFPKDKDPELASLYMAEVGDDAAAVQALKMLKGHASVEFAEPEVRRKLIQ